MARRPFSTGESLHFSPASRQHTNRSWCNPCSRNPCQTPLTPSTPSSPPPPPPGDAKLRSILSQSLPLLLACCCFAGAGALARRGGRRGGEGEREDEGGGGHKRAGDRFGDGSGDTSGPETGQCCSAQSSETFPVSSASQHPSTCFLAEKEPTTTTAATARATTQIRRQIGRQTPAAQHCKTPRRRQQPLHNTDTPTVAAPHRSALFA